MHEDRVKHLLRALEENIRFDGRKRDEFRELSIELDIANTAEGSAKVTLGDTIVIAGVKLEMGTPYPDAPDQGNLMVGAELLPLSSDRFEAGPPSIESIELARVLDRTIRESQAINLSDLCVEKGEKVWTVICDLCPINDGGNLFDAASLAVLAALSNTRFPEYKDGQVNYKVKTDKKLSLHQLPLGVTVWRCGDQLIVDPISDEEHLLEARLTVGSLADGNICALQKGGKGPLSAQQIMEMTELALDKAQKMRKQLDAALKG